MYVKASVSETAEDGGCNSESPLYGQRWGTAAERQ